MLEVVVPPLHQRFTVYCYTSLITGKKYVGQTGLSREKRWAGHLAKGCVYPFAAAIREFGRNAWTYETLDVVTTRKGARIAEARWIGHLGTLVPDGYNVVRASQRICPPHAKIQTKWIRCSKADCNVCRDGRGHGPYVQAMWWQDGHCRTKYIGKPKAESG